MSYLTCYCILCAQSADRSSPGSGQWSASQLPHVWQCSAGLPVSGSQSRHCPGSREGRRNHSGDWGSHPSGVSIAVSQGRENMLNKLFLWRTVSGHSVSTLKSPSSYWGGRKTVGLKSQAVRSKEHSHCNDQQCSLPLKIIKSQCSQS